MVGELLSLACALVWGVSVILFKKVEEIPPAGMNLFKNALATALLGLTLVAMGQGLDLGRSRADWLRLAVSGAIGLSIADTLFLESLRRLGPGLVAILDCVYAPLVTLFSVLLLGERLDRAFLLGAPLVVGGIVIATWQRAGGRAPAAVRSSPFAIALCLLSITLMALGIVLAKPALGGGAGVVEVTFVRLGFGTIFLWAWVLVRPGRRANLAIFRPQRVWTKAVPAALLGTYVAMLLWIGGMTYTSASTASVLNQLSVVFTLLLARAMLGEPLTSRRVWGGGASVAGAIIIVLGAAS